MTTNRVTATKPNILRLRYFGEIINELRKVVWLPRREAAYLTALVLIVTIASGLMLGALDYGFTNLLDKLFLGK